MLIDKKNRDLPEWVGVPEEWVMIMPRSSIG
jgi:hypothetical protein